MANRNDFETMRAELYTLHDVQESSEDESYDY